MPFLSKDKLSFTKHAVIRRVILVSSPLPVKTYQSNMNYETTSELKTSSSILYKRKKKKKP